MHCTNIESIWEYSGAVLAGEIDWRVEVGLKCPICGQEECWREISPYRRRVIELFPYREGQVWIARFLCRRTGLTFSLLPYWLVPYHQYTAASMVLALLMAGAKNPEKMQSLFSFAEKELEVESRATGWLLQYWLNQFTQGFRSARVYLSCWFDLSTVVERRRPTRWRIEVGAYCRALGIRGPPGKRRMHELLKRYADKTHRFLFGVPSQHRRGGSMP